MQSSLTTKKVSVPLWRRCDLLGPVNIGRYRSGSGLLKGFSFLPEGMSHFGMIDRKTKKASKKEKGRTKPADKKEWNRSKESEIESRCISSFSCQSQWNLPQGCVSARDITAGPALSIRRHRDRWVSRMFVGSICHAPHIGHALLISWAEGGRLKATAATALFLFVHDHGRRSKFTSFTVCIDIRMNGLFVSGV